MSTHEELPQSHLSWRPTGRSGGQRLLPQEGSATSATSSGTGLGDSFDVSATAPGRDEKTEACRLYRVPNPSSQPVQGHFPPPPYTRGTPSSSVVLTQDPQALPRHVTSFA